MQYRKFGKLDFQVSALGFGTMRLPTREGQIDEAEAMKMLRYAVDQGVNYVDTAYLYHEGTSEGFAGRALRDGYREKVKVATKLPSWRVKSASDFDKYLNEQLERLGMEYVDFYLLHSLKKEYWLKLYNLGVLKWAEKAMADGRFRHLAFSFHDDLETFKQIIDAYNWPMCQIQYNYMDVENQAGVEGLQYAAAKGIAIVVMEPLLGGSLTDPPASIQSVWDQAPRRRTAVDWALQWLWNQPKVSTVLSGMSTMAQVEENVACAAASGIGLLTPAELALVDEVRLKYEALTAIPCTGCRYCMPCPQHVDIPENLSNYNDGIKYDKHAAACKHYSWLKEAYEKGSCPEDIRAAACIACGECEAKCPQAIPISKWMPIIHDVLAGKKPFVTRL